MRVWVKRSGVLALFGLGLLVPLSGAHAASGKDEADGPRAVARSAHSVVSQLEKTASRQRSDDAAAVKPTPATPGDTGTGHTTTSDATKPAASQATNPNPDASQLKPVTTTDDASTPSLTVGGKGSGGDVATPQDRSAAEKPAAATPVPVTDTPTVPAAPVVPAANPVALPPVQSSGVTAVDAGIVLSSETSAQASRPAPAAVRASVQPAAVINPPTPSAKSGFYGRLYQSGQQAPAWLVPAGMVFVILGVIIAAFPLLGRRNENGFELPGSLERVA